MKLILKKLIDLLEDSSKVEFKDVTEPGARLVTWKWESDSGDEAMWVYRQPRGFLLCYVLPGEGIIDHAYYPNLGKATSAANSIRNGNFKYRVSHKLRT